MREIKFRAWDSLTNSMRNSVYVIFDTEQGKVTPFNHVGNPMRDFKLMQFTGLKDKHGNEIYEGDLFLLDEDDSIYGAVVFDDGKYKFQSYGCDGALMEYGFDENAGGESEHLEDMDDYCYSDMEIIGNVHLNPELLK